jgi:hypothetical protein
MIDERDAAAATFVRMNSLPVLDPQSPEARAIFHLAIVSGIIYLRPWLFSDLTGRRRLVLVAWSPRQVIAQHVGDHGRQH